KLSEEIKKAGKVNGFKVEVLNKVKIESLRMGGLIAVNKGSIDPPTFNIMEYKPSNAKNKKPYVLVGKGIVFDTGGVNIKTQGMELMKCDMGGAAAVIGAICAIAAEKLPLHVIALVPATDNRPGGNAYVPSDIITMFDGTTVEVLNTDAEGRMVLADALSYAKKYKPELVIDVATLTGSAVRSIGMYGLVAMGNSENEMDKLKESGNQVYERIVEFPLWDEYAEEIKSEVADIKNIGSSLAGATTAGKFLEHFTDYPWMHLDIAGPSFFEKHDHYRVKGGSGYGVRLLYNFLKKQVVKEEN
ncbi:MAG: M17 family metallopeptidase, partial [Bacteroidota bacterium]|nr:M17 family metallopeptidase [Bacteroidota bacterium]